MASATNEELSLSHPSCKGTARFLNNNMCSEGKEKEGKVMGIGELWQNREPSTVRHLISNTG